MWAPIIEAFWQPTSFKVIKWYLLYVDQFLKVLRNTEGVKEHGILIESKMYP
jgi:hypothetical protein